MPLEVIDWDKHLYNYIHHGRTAHGEHDIELVDDHYGTRIDPWKAYPDEDD